MNVMKSLGSVLILLLIGCSVIAVVTADTQANNTGSLRVSSNPSGASVYLDSVYKGLTPESGSYISIPNLTPKEYTLTLKKSGYLDFITAVGIVANDTVTVSVNLTPGSPAETSSTPVIIIGVLIVIVIIVAIVLVVTRRKKPEKVEKIEYD